MGELVVADRLYYVTWNNIMFGFKNGFVVSNHRPSYYDRMFWLNSDKNDGPNYKGFDTKEEAILWINSVVERQVKDLILLDRNIPKELYRE